MRDLIRQATAMHVARIRSGYTDTSGRRREYESATCGAPAAMALKLGRPALLGPACPQRDLALGLVISQAVAPASNLAAFT